MCHIGFQSCQVPADIHTSKQNLASETSVPIHRIPAQNGASSPEHSHAVAFTSTVGISSSVPAPIKAEQNGAGIEKKLNGVSTKVTRNIGIRSKEENSCGGLHSKEVQRGGRPVPGSSSFVRENRIDTSTAQVKKLLSGDYLTFYMGNLSYRADDMKIKAAIENRLQITVDQAVVAYSSDGRSRGCAFVTVRWKEYRDSHSDSNSQSLVQKFCERLTGKPLFGRPVFVELASSQRRGG